jgi:hypothetical protein
MELLNKTDLPEGFEYPAEFLRIIDQNLTDLEPWAILSGEYLRDRYKGLKDRYKNKTLIPFARRLDNDDLACWDISTPGKVLIIHDFASAGWEQRQQFETFWDWFKKAIDDMIEHDL